MWIQIYTATILLVMNYHAPESTREQIGGNLLRMRDRKHSGVDELVEGKGWRDWISDGLDVVTE